MENSTVSKRLLFLLVPILLPGWSAAQNLGGHLLERLNQLKGAIDSAERIDVFDIRLGDCFNDESSAGTDGVSEVYGLDVVPCADPHDNEVFAVFDLELAAFPEGDVMDDIAGEECLQRFEPYVGRDYETSSLAITALYPTRQSWNERRDREVACILFDMDLSKMQGRMKGSGI